MELFFHPASPNCMGVLVAAAHLGARLEHRFVDLIAGEQGGAEYLAINPNGTVPTLRDGDFILWETTAVLQYLAARPGDTPLWPPHQRARADIARWQVWSLAHWTPALQPYVFENLFKRLRSMGDTDTSVLKAALEKLNRYGAVLNDHLRGRNYVVGKVMTLADISLAAYLMYAEPARIPLDGLPEIRRWFAGIEALPAWRAAQPQAPP